MAGGAVRGEKALAGVKEEPGLTSSQMSTQPHPFRSHTGVLERGIGREPLLSSASTQEFEEALAARRVKSQAAREKNEREQKKPRLQGRLEPGLPGFGTQSARDGGQKMVSNALTSLGTTMTGTRMMSSFPGKSCMHHIPRMRCTRIRPHGFEVS